MKPSEKPAATDTIDAVAAQWLSRRDRDLTAIEQDAYLQWLREDPRHGVAITRLEKAWGALDQLTEWRPKHSQQPNPDLLAPKRRGKIYWLSTAAFAAAAAFALLLFVSLPRTAAHRQAIIHPGPERLVLEDGSVIELNTGAKVDVHFTADLRRVQLVRGEAHFTVAKNKDRPFIVSADKVAVRAVGTAFSVSLNPQEVSVLVTEGTVHVAESAVEENESTTTNCSANLNAGQQTVIMLAMLPLTAATPAAAPIVVQDVTPAQIARSLAWQGMRLEFVDMPLGDVVGEFNRYNRQKLVVGDSATATILVGGNFRADNVAGFVRLLELSFGVTATAQGDNFVLNKTAE